jgi:hypothetical protein
MDHHSQFPGMNVGNRQTDRFNARRDGCVFVSSLRRTVALTTGLNLASAIFSAVLRNFFELKNFHLADTFIVTERLHLASSTRSLGFARSVNLNWEHQRKQTADHEDQKCTGRRYVSEAPE